MKTRQGSACVLALAAALLVAGCGGGGDGGSTTASCTVAEEQNWLRGYMDSWYLWTALSPKPDPAGFATVNDYFTALKFGGNATIPADRWSFSQTSASFNQFFAEGQTMGYGLFVNGIELVLPLKVRYTEPDSPAAKAGLKRGDVIVSLNGRTSKELIDANDFAVLTPAKEGDTLQVVVENGAGTATYNLVAATFNLTPVPLAPTVLTTPLGTKAGYLVLKDFISQAEVPLAASLAEIRRQGATELILDLRYNGGGRVDTAQKLASMIAGGPANAGKTFARLTYNAAHQGSNAVYPFSSSTTAPFSRVIVLTGSRTCSASELVVNGLKPVADVVTIGGTTCGKPVGFNPTAQCGNTYSVVTFESVNANGVGGYYDGLAATCAVADDFAGPLGVETEKLTAAALRTIDGGGTCPAGARAPADKAAQSALRRRALAGEPGERRGMWVD